MSRCSTHPHIHMHNVQAGRAKNGSVHEIRFLGGFAMDTGLQSTAALGRRRSRVRCWRDEWGRGQRYQAGAVPLLSEWVAWESDFLHCPPFYSVMQKWWWYIEGKQQKGQENRWRVRKSPGKKIVVNWEHYSLCRMVYLLQGGRERERERHLFVVF